MIIRALFCLLLLCDSNFAQEIRDQPRNSRPPELKTFFVDHFDQDTRSDYQIDGDQESAIWNEGTLILKDGATVHRGLDAGSWVELVLDLQFPELTEDGQQSELKVWLDLEGSTDSLVWFRQKREGGVSRGAIFIVDSEGQWQRDPGLHPVRKPFLLPAEIPSGVWKITYRNGLWKINSPDQKANLIGYVDNGAAKVNRLALLASHKTIQIRSLTTRRVDRVAFLPTPTAKERIEKADALQRTLPQRLDGQTLPRAKSIATEFTKLRQSIYGRFHPEYLQSLNYLAVVNYRMRSLERAEQLFQELTALQKTTLGDEHPEYARSLNNLAAVYDAMGAFQKCEPLYLNILEIRKQAFGVEHPLVAASLNGLALHYYNVGSYEKAEPLYLQSRGILKKLVGVKHRDFSTNSTNLGQVYSAMGDYEKAEPLCIESCEILKSLAGDKDPDYAMSLSNLASLYVAMGAPERAEPRLLKARDILRKVHGERHPDYTLILNNLALLYHDLGDFKRAEPLYQQTIKLRKQIFGQDHPAYANSVNNLAGLYDSTGDYQQALPLYEEARAIWKKWLGEQHPQYAQSLHNLADVYHSIGDYDKAEPLYIQSRTIMEKAFGREHPFYATSLNNLASLYASANELAKAERLFIQTQDILQKALGEQHPKFATALGNRAELYQLMGDFDRAAPLFLDSLKITRLNLDRFSSIQSEKQRQEFAKTHEYRLSDYISNALQLEDQGERVWKQAVRWKGISLLREKRNLILASLPATRDLFKQLKSIRSRMSKHLQADPSQPGWKLEASRLASLEEQSEKRLARIVDDLDASWAAQPDSDIRLPANSCLIDFRRFTFSEPAPEVPDQFRHEPRYLALIRRSDDRVTMLDLGSAERIESAISRWRTPIEKANRDGQAIPPNDDLAMDRAGLELRKLLWEPLQSHIDDLQLVIVSPAGALGRMPIIALPGKQPGTYLLEEKRIVYLPVPALLPQMLASDSKAINQSTPALLVGAIDYGIETEPVSPQQRGNQNLRILRDLQFGRLPNTGKEVEGIAQLFERATQLTGDQATERALQRDLPGRAVLHIATHGFFRSPDRFRKSLPSNQPDSFKLAREQVQILTENPNLLSGLALANANSGSGKNQDEASNDGILYSAEIAMMPMDNVQLAVLSACETSLGTDDNPGEGLIGIQRAFQVAGVKSTVASYWKVDDSATQLLMNRFYQNLIEYAREAESKDSKAEPTTVRVDALRDAQLWMLNHPVVASATNRGEPVEVDPKKIKRIETSPDDQRRRTHPRYWAAFMLSGDWR